jgi:hypothetical protein
MKIRDMNETALARMAPRLGLARSRKGAWRRGRLDLTGGDLFLHDGNVRWRRRAVSDGNPRSPARSPSCRDCAFLPVVRFRCLCRDRCRLSVTPSARRCVFDWWRVARHERSCCGDSAVDRWASRRGVRELSRTCRQLPYEIDDQRTSG